MIYNKAKQYALPVLMVVQALLLFSYYPSIPFSHDELSAITRCRFGNLNDLFQWGIRPDGHPAGVQLLLYYLIKLLGISEPVLKLPFAIAGCLSLYCLFRIAEKLFDARAAVFSSLLFIGSQYVLFQMTQARPYSPGVFFSLAVFYCNLLIKDKPEKGGRYLLLSILITAACYTHYFSFLQVMVIQGLCTLFYYKHYQKHFYAVAIALSLICFLPHWPITEYQLSMGGLGWLGPPGFAFFKSFFLTLCNRSEILLLIFSAAVATGLLYKSRTDKNVLLLLLMFAIPVLVLFLYSRYRAPVMQDAALYFSIPFLIILSGRALSYTNKYLYVASIGITAAAGFGSLFFNTHYLQYKTYQPMDRFITASEQLSAVNKGESALTIWKGNHQYLQYFIDKRQFIHPVVTTDTLKNISGIDFQAYEFIICNNLEPVDMAALGRVFPFVNASENNYLFNALLLSCKTGGDSLYHTLANPVFELKTGDSWSAPFVYKLNEHDRFNFLECFIQPDTTGTDIELVAETYSGDVMINRNAVLIEANTLLSLKMKDIVMQEPLKGESFIKFYLWQKNKGHQPHRIQVVLKERKDNPLEYRFSPSH